jgi:hypothetical protein
MVAFIRRFVVAVMVATLTITAGPAHSAAQPVKACPKYHAAMRKAGLPPACSAPLCIESPAATLKLLAGTISLACPIKTANGRLRRSTSAVGPLERTTAACCRSIAHG